MSTKKPRNKSVSKGSFMNNKRREYLSGYLFCLPFIIGFIFLFSNGVIKSLMISFSSIVVQGNEVERVFVKFSNYYKALFVDPTFLRMIGESIGMLILNVIIITIYALFVATMLNQSMKFRGFVRALFFLPVIISTGIITKVESMDTLITGSMISSGVTSAVDTASAAASGNLFSFDEIMNILMSIQISPQFTKIVMGAFNNISSIIAQSGVQMIIFLGGMQSISASIYEAAEVEGATGWENFWKITLPIISPLALVNVVYTVVDSFTGSSNKVMESIRTITLTATTVDYGLGAAMSWVYFIVVLVLLAIIMGVMSFFVSYQNK